MRNSLIFILRYVLAQKSDEVRKYYQINDKVRIGGFKFLMLNSVIPDDEDPTTNKSRGLLTNDKLDFVKNEIKDGTPDFINASPKLILVVR